MGDREKTYQRIKNVNGNNPTLKESDFLESSFGNYQTHSKSWRNARFGKITDLIFDWRLKLNPNYKYLNAAIANLPLRKILAVGVEVPSRVHDLDAVANALSETRHDLTFLRAPLEPGKGKFQNINQALRAVDINEYDWLLIIDDDILFEKNFLDTFIYIAEAAKLEICQAAHKFYSYQSFILTQRQWNSFARVTRFVECGPFTAFYKSAFSAILPFPDLRWAWGTDIAWSEMARDKFRMGIVDATPIRHWRKVANTYSMSAASEECKAFLKQLGITRPKHEILKTVEIIDVL